MFGVLHLPRRLGESIMIGDDCLLTVVQLHPGRRAATILIGRPSPGDPDELETHTVELARDATHRISATVSVTLAAVSADKAMLAVDAPKDVSIHRLEVYEAIQRERRK